MEEEIMGTAQNSLKLSYIATAQLTVSSEPREGTVCVSDVSN
jgi:hypothetical protein